MGVIKGIPEKGQNRNRGYRTNPETANRSQQDSDWLNLTIEKDRPFKQGITYNGVTIGLEKCPKADGREQVRLKADYFAPAVPPIRYRIPLIRTKDTAYI